MTVPGDFYWPKDAEPLVTWERDGFRLILCDYQPSPGEGAFGRQAVRYKFYHDGRLVFAGGDYSPSPLYSVDGEDSIRGLLEFLALRPGDADRECFDQYTPEQMAFAVAHGEELSMLAEDFNWADCVYGVE